MSRSDYDDMPSNGGGRRGKGNKSLTLGVLICILVILIIIVVRLIFKPEEKLEVLPPNAVVKENSVTNEVSEKSATPTLDDNAIDLTVESVDVVVEDPLSSEIDETSSLETDSEEEIIHDEESQTIEGQDGFLEDTIEIEGVVEESSVETLDETNAEENAEDHTPLVDEEPMVDGSEEGSLEREIVEDFSEIDTQSEGIETENEDGIPETTEIVTEDFSSGEINDEESFIVLDTPSEEKVEDVTEEPIIVPVVEDTIDEPIEEVEEESLPYDPFMEEDVETLRKGLGDLLSRIDFSLILAEDEQTVEEELPIEESINEEEIENGDVDIPVFSNESENLVIKEAQTEIDDEKSQINDNDGESIIEKETQNNSSEELTQEVLLDEVELEESLKVSKTLAIEEKSASIIQGSIVIVDGESVTLLSTPGKAVKSPIDGVVKEAKRVEGKKTISIETEEGDVWRFSGFERVNVKLNQSVREGEVLGSVGTSSGSSIDISIL